MNSEATTGGLSSSKVWSFGLIAAAGAAAVNVVILLIGKAADVPFLAPNPADRTVNVALTVGMVIAATVFSLGIGTLLVAVVAPRIHWGVSRVQAVVAVLTVLSLGAPLTLQGAASTKVWLAAMHLMTGALFIGALRLAGRK